MAWKLLLTLAVLGTLPSLRDCGCSTDTECTSVCGTCDTLTSRPPSCVSFCAAGTICNVTADPPRCVCEDTACRTKCGGEPKLSCCSTAGTTCSCCSSNLKSPQTCLTVSDKRAKSSSWSYTISQMERTLNLTGTCQNLCEKDGKTCDDTNNCEKCHPDPDNSKKKVCMPCSYTKKCNSEGGGRTACCNGKDCVCCEAGQTCKDKSCQIWDRVPECFAETCGRLCGAKCDPSGNGKCVDPCIARLEAEYRCDFATSTCKCDETACNSMECGSCESDVNECVSGGNCDPGQTCAADDKTCECTESSYSAACYGTCANNGTSICVTGPCEPEQECTKDFGPGPDGGYSCQCSDEKCGLFSDVRCRSEGNQGACCNDYNVCHCYSDASSDCGSQAVDR